MLLTVELLHGLKYLLKKIQEVFIFMDMENTSIPKLLLKMSPPVMLALLIQSIYNIADSYFLLLTANALVKSQGQSSISHLISS